MRIEWLLKACPTCKITWYFWMFFDQPFIVMYFIFRGKTFCWLKVPFFNFFSLLLAQMWAGKCDVHVTITVNINSEKRNIYNFLQISARILRCATCCDFTNSNAFSLLFFCLKWWCLAVDDVERNGNQRAKGGVWQKTKQGSLWLDGVCLKHQATKCSYQQVFEITFCLVLNLKFISMEIKVYIFCYFLYTVTFYIHFLICLYFFCLH